MWAHTVPGTRWPPSQMSRFLYQFGHSIVQFGHPISRIAIAKYFQHDDAVALLLRRTCHAKHRQSLVRRTALLVRVDLSRDQPLGGGLIRHRRFPQVDSCIRGRSETETYRSNSRQADRQDTQQRRAQNETVKHVRTSVASQVIVFSP